MLRLFIALFLLCFSLAARCASFDCTKAGTDVEKRICNVPELSKLDEDLDDQYADAILLFRDFKYDSTERERYIAEQRSWLTKTRNACRTDECLITAYTVRIKAMDPFGDASLTCEEMRRNPILIFGRGGVDLGSGHGSPLEVEYNCKESLASLHFLAKVLSQAEGIRGGSSCDGSIVYAQMRGHMYSLLEAGIAPKVYLKYSSQTPPERSYRTILSYLESWSWQSSYNLETYRPFIAELKQAETRLAEHFQKTNGFSKSDAAQLAGQVVTHILYRAAGSYPSGEFEEPSKLAKISADTGTSIEALRTAIADSSVKETFRRDAYQALGVALLHGQPQPFIAELMKALGKFNEEELHPAGEPILIYALKQTDMLQRLIDLGASVNYQNNFGKTALFYAIESNNRAVVELLLRNGADINHPYKSAEELYGCSISRTKRTPLMHAAQHADVAMLKLLIERGARPLDRDEHEWDAVKYAEEENKPENATFL